MEYNSVQYKLTFTNEKIILIYILFLKSYVKFPMVLANNNFLRTR